VDKENILALTAAVPAVFPLWRIYAPMEYNCAKEKNEWSWSDAGI
jgi:hypothetical protein